MPCSVSTAVTIHTLGSNEWAVYVDDIMLRRTGWRHYRTDADEIARQVAGWMTNYF